MARRSAQTLKATPEIQLTDAERILIRALASSRDIQPSEEHRSSREGSEEEFDPARQARFVLQRERLHAGIATEALIDVMLGAPESAGPMELPLAEAERNLLAGILLREEEELTADTLEGAVRGLRRIQLRRRLEQVQGEIQAEGRLGREQLAALLREKDRLARALRDPNPSNSGPVPPEGSVRAET